MGDQRLSDRSAPGTPLCGQACVWHKTCAGLWGKIHAVRGAADGPGPADAKGMIASDFNTKEMAALFGILPKAVNRHRATVMPQRPGHGRVQLAGPALKAQQGHLRSGPGRAAPHPARLWTMRQLLFGLPWVVMLAMGDTRADAQGTEPPQQALPSDTRAGHCTAVTAQSSACDAIRARPILDAASPPWSAIGRVNFASIQTRTHCTGVLISEDRVLTAAHCLYNAHRKIWIPVTSLKFVAGYQRGKALATSDVARAILDPVHTPKGPGFLASPRSDWAILVLTHPIGRNTGHADIRPWAEVPDAGRAATFAGYAGLRPHVLTHARDCGDTVSTRGLLVNRCAAMPGDSGAPLISLDHGKILVHGVLSGTRNHGKTSVSVFVPIPQALRTKGAADR